MPGREVWLGALRRFNEGEGSLPQAFALRRARLLTVMAWVAMLGSIPWASYFILMGRPLAALLPGSAVLAGALTLGLLRLHLHRVAVLLFSLGCLLAVLGMCLLLDLPSAGAPRSTHLYLLPLFVCVFYFLQYGEGWLRLLVSALLLGAFVLLQSAELRFVDAPPMPASVRQQAVWAVALLTVVMLYLCVVTMLRDARQATELELDFARGIAAGEIEPFFQAQCDAEGRLMGAEVLMRWRHPLRGLVPPGEFIPMAEATGLIKPAGQRLLEQVCSLLLQWQQGGALAGLPMAINVSSVQLQSDAATERLIETVPRALREAGLIKFELTESAYAQDFDDLLAKMQAMRAQGIRLALDDFGTGFSSLSLLKRLPLHQLKVDQSFVRDLPDDPDACHIAATIVRLGRDLGLDVVAEGVETQAQLDCLRAMGCSAFQGFLFARPLSAESFANQAALWRRGLKPPAGGV